LLVVPANIFAASPQDNKGLLPPVSTDRSPRVAPIRSAIATADLLAAQKKTDEMMREEPGNFEGYYWRGFLELERDNGYDAVRFLRRAEALDANPHVLKLLAFSYYTVRQFRLFLLKMNAALAQQPDDYAPYYYMGRYYFEDTVGDFPKAEDNFRKAIERNPGHFQSHYYLGWCEEVQRQGQDGEQEYRRSMELAEAAGAKFAGPWEGMARIRLLEDKPAEALPYATHAVEYAPNDAASHKVLARTYTALGKQAEAMVEWERVAALDPADSAPYYRLYRIYLEMGNKDKANAAYAEFQKLSAMY
jgi:tetratricopeptide (TPR) repeat protein